MTGNPSGGWYQFPVAVTWAFALSVGACVPGDGGRGADDDPAAPRWLRAGDVPEWSAELELRIGSLDDPEYSLTYVRSLEVAPDGLFMWDPVGKESCSRRLAVLLDLPKGMDSGLGYLINDARNAGSRYDLVVATMLVIGVIGIVLDYLIRRLEQFDEVRWGYVTR